MSDNPLAALAMRERAAKACDGFCSECARAIRALPTTLPDAELLAAAWQLPEVRALIEAATLYVSLVQGADFGRQLRQYDALVAALAPFTKGAS
jgi:hypothetical protein